MSDYESGGIMGDPYASFGAPKRTHDATEDDEGGADTGVLVEYSGGAGSGAGSGSRFDGDDGDDDEYAAETGGALAKRMRQEYVEGGHTMRIAAGNDAGNLAMVRNTGGASMPGNFPSTTAAGASGLRLGSSLAPALGGLVDNGGSDLGALGVGELGFKYIPQGESSLEHDIDQPISTDQLVRIYDLSTSKARVAAPVLVGGQLLFTYREMGASTAAPDTTTTVAPLQHLNAILLIHGCSNATERGEGASLDSIDGYSGRDRNMFETARDVLQAFSPLGTVRSVNGFDTAGSFDRMYSGFGVGGSSGSGPALSIAVDQDGQVDVQDYWNTTVPFSERYLLLKKVPVTRSIIAAGGYEATVKSIASAALRTRHSPIAYAWQFIPMACDTRPAHAITSLPYEERAAATFNGGMAILPVGITKHNSNLPFHASAIRSTDDSQRAYNAQTFARHGKNISVAYDMAKIYYIGC